MTGGYLFLLGSLVGFSLLGILHKVADHPSCRPRMITMLLLLWGAVLTAAYTVAFDKHGLHMPASVLGMGAAAGAAASLALFAFQASLRYGKISTSWLVLNLCVAVPLLISIIVYGEELTAGKSVGVAMVFGAILLMWWDKRIDLARAGANHGPGRGRRRDGRRDDGRDVARGERTPDDADHRHLASKSKWLSLIMLAFLANGLAASSQKVLVELGDGDYVVAVLRHAVPAGAVVVTVANAFNSRASEPREVLVSGAMAVASVAGNICIVRSPRHARAWYDRFPGRERREPVSRRPRRARCIPRAREPGGPGGYRARYRGHARPRYLVEPRRSARANTMAERTQAGQAYNELTLRIQTGEIAAGERIVEELWAERIGVNRAAIREGLTRLLGEGFVRQGERGGFFVAEMSDEEIRQIREVREILETSAFRLACERATAEQKAQLAEACDDFESFVKKGYRPRPTRRIFGSITYWSKRRGTLAWQSCISVRASRCFIARWPAR